ncbi:MAG: class I SAM-dependent methyltransferase [Deltaproteobacteria bacterium]|nr:class I SAM-dependent methyltransferase [Deltaproteobacteria bacterium]
MNPNLELTPQFWRDYVLSRKRSLPRKNIATGKKWDQMAEHYHTFEEDESFVAEQQWIKTGLIQRGMLNPDQEIIDIACGPGTHCFDFARSCRHVTAVDVSSKMIEQVRLRQKKEQVDNLTVICHDFYDFQPQQQYDTVFVSMSPILNELESVDRLLKMSRRNLVLIYWAGVRDNPLFQNCFKMIYDEAYQWDAMDITTIFNYLNALGYSPEITYLHPLWKRHETLAHTVEHLIWHLEFYRSLSDAEKKKVYDLTALEADSQGMVTYLTRVRKGALFLDLEAGRKF